MALPTKDDLATLDYVYQGAPFVQVEAKNLDSATLDVVYQAQPFVGAKSVGIYVLTAEQGIFILTCNQVDLKRALAVFGGSGGYIFSGSAAGLQVNRFLAAQTGSFTVAGNLINFIRQLVINLDLGVFTLTGSNVDYRRDYKVFVDSGQYLFTGNEINTNYQSLVSTGAFNLTGNQTGLKRQYNFPVFAGNFTVVGNSINTVKGYSINALTASYLLAGDTTVLKRSLIFQIQTGSFNLTGGNSFVIRIFNCQTGSFVLTGIPVDLQSSAPVNSFGSYEPNYVGLIEALIDLKLTIENTALAPFPDIGFIATTFENVFQGDAVYLRNSDGKIGRAIANSTLERATVVGLAETTKLAGEPVRVLTLGKTAATGLSPGEQYFLSAASPGSITATPPSANGNYVVFVGEACSNSELIVDLKFPVLLS